MKIYLVIARDQDDKGSLPWIAEACDEFALEENNSLLEGLVTKTSNIHGGENVRVVVLHADQSILNKAFEIPVFVSRDEGILKNPIDPTSEESLHLKHQGV